ncbi:Sugar and carbohydrate transporter [Planctomycetales bacterium 10988]|nr:Sugar and carbohydrate transporter [Planctomycetales bacterium 10988]
MKKYFYLFQCTLVAALGGLLFGFDTAVISGAEEKLQSLWELSNFWHGFTTASALIGTIVGSLIAGKPADRFGRRTTLFGIAFLYLFSALGSALAWDWYSFVLFRLMGGIGVGGASVVSPLYIAETSPANIRGRLVALVQFNIVFGILLAYLSNFFIDALKLGEVEWRWMFGVEAFPAFLFFLLLLLTPRSPRWLVTQNHHEEAEEVLLKLGNSKEQTATELAAIEQSLKMDQHRLEEPFFQKVYAQPIFLAIAIAAFNQLSGINAILYYSKRIFVMAGAGDSAALLNSVGIGIVNLLFTSLAIFVIDYIGRKKLMIVGSIGYILSLSITAWAFLQFDSGEQAEGVGSLIVLGSLMLFIAAHAFGQGAVIWVFISEIFPNRVRARGQALGSFTHWVMAAVISWTFPLFADLTGGYIFAFYALMMVFQLIWVIFYMPETKGVPLEEIQKRLGIE